MNMIVESYPLGPIDTNCILIGCPKTLKAAIIDAPQGALDFMMQRANELSLKVEGLLLTHTHWDHIVDAAALKKVEGLPIYVHPLDQQNLKNPGADRLPLFFSVEGVEADHLINDRDRLKIGNLEIEVIHTPGHSPGSVCFYFPQENILISGDTLFKSSIGKTSFPTSRPNLMWESLIKLSQLPPKTRVFPGHGDETTIEAERAMCINAKQRFGG